METETAIVLVNPNGSQDIIVDARKRLMARQRADVEEIEAATAKLATDGIKGHLRKAFDEKLKVFKTAGEKLSADICAATGADAIFVQLKASETAVKDAVKAYQAKWDEAKTTLLPPEERFEYIIEMCLTEAEYTRMRSSWTKSGVEFRARRVLDGESAKVGKMFAEKEGK